MPAVTSPRDFEGWRSKIVKDGGLNDDNLAQFILWARETYGVTLEHLPHY